MVLRDTGASAPAKPAVHSVTEKAVTKRCPTVTEAPRLARVPLGTRGQCDYGLDFEFQISSLTLTE